MRRVTQKGVAMTEELQTATSSTPGRSEEGSIPGKENLAKEEAHSVTNQVTPADSVKADLHPDEEEDEQEAHRLLPGQVDSKHVRFGSAAHVANEEEESDTSNSNPVDSPSQRGLVSKRGRYVSPGRRAANSNSPRTDAVLEYKTFRSPPRKREDHEVPSLCSTNSGALCETDKEGKPTSSISCDQSAMDNTSPLTSHDAADRKNDREPADKDDGHVTPTRNTELQITDGLGDPKFGSPGGLILASNSPMSMNRGGLIKVSASFEEKKETASEELKPSPRRDREHFVATPTDFALDYGKDHHTTGSFDTSNVLAWLQSPTSNGLFSPGGLGSIMNTPGARTPRTPTVSTSFFFSDVASLPRGETFSPKDGANARSQKGISNIICISPLASSRTRNGTSTTNTPNFKEIFSSPQEKSRIRGLPLLNETPSKGRPQIPQRSASKDPSLDAVHLAERDVMEDEDMNVLLQLASNTPGRSSGAGGPVFRSPGGRKKNDEMSENLPTLQLPMIGGREGEAGSTSLSRKASSRDQTDVGDFAPPTLGMRSNSSTGTKEILVGTTLKEKLKAGSPSRSSKETKGSKKPASGQYSMHPPPYPDVPYYVMPPPDGLRPEMLPGPGGSMRVVIGGPPPPRDGKSGSPPRMSTSPHRSTPHYPPPPAGMYPPPPPGMFSSYPPHMGYPYQSHYPPPPPPRHMPLYGAQLNAGGASKNTLKKGKSPKSVKRAGSPILDPKDPPSSKKAKKAQNGQTKKKRSPPITDRVERQKAAVTIQQVNAASGGKNDRAAALAAAILRGVTMRPSGKWQAQLYFAGKSRYIGVFDSREKAALAYEIAREKLKSGPKDSTGQSTENLVNAARKAAFDGVNEQLK